MPVGKIAKAAKKLADEWDEAAWLKENPEPPGTKRSNPEKKRWLEKRHYYRNRQKKLDRVRERYEANAEEIKAAERQRYQDNRESLLEGKREYYKNNKQAAIANANKRKADQLQRTPDYSDSDAIKRLYEQAGLLSEATGTLHHVDHVIPLRGKNVSGLHVPGNLMIVPDNLNLSKSNKFTPGDDPMRFNDVAQQNITEQNARGLLDSQSGAASPELLGLLGGGAAAGLAAPVLMKNGVFQHTASETPIAERKEPVRNQSALLADITGFGDEVFKSVRHAAGPVADVLMPFEGVNNYLKTVNDYDKQPTWWDRLGLLDI